MNTPDRISGSYDFTEGVYLAALYTPTGTAPGPRVCRGRGAVQSACRVVQINSRMCRPARAGRHMREGRRFSRLRW